MARKSRSRKYRGGNSTGSGNNASVPNGGGGGGPGYVERTVGDLTQQWNNTFTKGPPGNALVSLTGQSVASKTMSGGRRRRRNRSSRRRTRHRRRS